MSIIQEALKRKEEEGMTVAGRTVRPPVAPLTTPASPPLPPLTGSAGKSRSPLMPMLLVLVGLVVIAGAIFYLFGAGIRDILNKSKGDETVNVADASTNGQGAKTEIGEPKLIENPKSKLGRILDGVRDVVATEDQRIEDGRPITDGAKLPPSGAESKVGAPEVTETPAVVQTPPVAGTPVVVQTPPVTGTPVVVQTPLVTEEPSEVTVGETKKSGVASLFPFTKGKKEDETSAFKSNWPVALIKGIMAPGRGNRGSVLIDSNILIEGDTYRGITIVKITEGMVLLEFKGKKRLLSSGQSTGVE